MSNTATKITAMSAIDSVPLFKDFSDTSKSRLNEIVVSQTAAKGEHLLEQNETVPGLFVLTDGEVLVEIGDRVLARIRSGGIFGEMSFLGMSDKASATIKVESNTASYLFCSRKDLVYEIEHNDRLSRDFFKSVSILMSDRLRTTNNKMNTELKNGFSKIADLLIELDENSKIDQTRDSLDETGLHIVNKLLETIPIVEELETRHPNDKEQFKLVLDNLKEIMIEDSQSFDRICQKIDQLRQYFDNLKTIITGSGMFNITGDRNLINKDQTQQGTIEFL